MVTDDPSAATELVARGEDVVLIVGSGTDARVTPVDPLSQGAGRLAVFVGDASDPATTAAAQEMDNELFSNRR